MSEDEIFLLVKTQKTTKCRLSPVVVIQVLYNRRIQAAVMLGPDEGEINLRIGQAKLARLLEDIIENPNRFNNYFQHCTAEKISDLNAAALFQKIVANCQRLAEEPSFAPAIKGFIREQFDQITDSLYRG